MIPLRPYLKRIIPLLLALIVYLLLCYHLNFIQDDAYISYRYVANFLNGHGLVYNIGERVEGFTNFGWVIYLIFWGSLGVSYIFISKLTGFLFGGGIIVLTFLMSKLVFHKKDLLFALLPVYLLAFNQSLAYWSPAGLETAAFAFFSLLSLYLYLKRSWFLIASLILVVWLRPEGVLITGLLIIIEIITEKRFPKYTSICAFIAFIFSLPFVWFKLYYYGSIFPNPFYAKTGFDFKQLSNGIEYSIRFFSHYGFYGIGLIIPLLFYRKLSSAAKSIFLFTFVYILYVILIGGDVLKVHRFWMPIFGSSAILISLSIWLLVKKMSVKNRRFVFVLVSIVLLCLTYYLPHKFVNNYNYLEKSFTNKMSFLAIKLKETDTTNFSVALPTIGIFGYELLGHDIIDMVGLTDSTIAKHTEKPVKGMSSTWKEQKYNSKYILTRAPNYIMFSTGIKPSAPAEKALLLFPQFLNCYRTIGWYYESYFKKSGSVQVVFKKVHKIKGKLVPTYPLSFVEDYKTGLDYYSAGNQRKAVEYFNRAVKESPEPVYIYLLYARAFSYFLLTGDDRTIAQMNSIIARDSTIFVAHRDLYMYDELIKDTVKANIHRRWLKKLVPWYLPRVDSQVVRMLKARNRNNR